MTPNILNSRGYVARVACDERDGILWSTVLGLTDHITCEGETLAAMAEVGQYAPQRPRAGV